jgi:hypothetical protein
MNKPTSNPSIIEETMEELLIAGIGETEMNEVTMISLHLDVDQIVAELQLGYWDPRLSY